MKFYKYSLIAALALSGALCACDDNDYAPGSPVSGDEVYFSLDNSDEVSIPNEATSVSIDVNRLKDADALTVDFDYTLTDAQGTPVTGIFTVPSQVSFAAGELVAPIVIGVDFAKVEADKEYVLTLKLKGDNTTPYGASERQYILSYAPWSEWELVPGEIGEYTFTLLSSIKGTYDCYVASRHSLVNPDNVQYAVIDLIDDGINFLYSMNLKNTIEVDGVECPMVTLTTYKSGLSNGGSDEYFWWVDVKDWIAEYWGLGWDRVDAIMDLNDFGQSYFNPETGLFAVDVAVISNECTPGTSEAYGVGYEYLQLPGYKSYEVLFDYTGNYVNAKGTEFAIVNAYKSDDVASFVYDLFPGELKDAAIDAAVEEIKANDELEAITESTTNLALVCPEDGKYTVVAVGRDADGNEVCKTAYTFNYSTVQGAPKWETIGFCEYTDGFMNSMFSSVGGETWDVEIQESTETAGLYRLVNPYQDWAAAYRVTYLSGDYYIVVHAENPNQVYLEESAIGLQVNTNGPLYVTSDAFDLLNDYSPEAIERAGYFGTLEDGVITFPAGVLGITYESFVEADKWYYANIDPENPTLDDETVQFNPYLGEGTFCIDMSSLSSAASMRVKATKSVPAARASNNLKTVKGRTKTTTVDAKTLQDYRRSNPRQYKF